MTERPRRRPHPAAATRIVVAGAAAAGTLGMVAAMAGPLVGGASTPSEAVPASLTSVPGAAVQSPDAPTRIVVVRRHHPIGGTDLTATPSRVAPSRVAPAVRPAPRPAPVVTKSRGS
ncbi:MAG TPA: hypothetical protein VFU14_03565 [Acidimicrobiales bacterium]|nr:hypothetical protein [Acidimicrobiales bacterium]